MRPSLRRIDWAYHWVWLGEAIPERDLEWMRGWASKLSGSTSFFVHTNNPSLEVPPPFTRVVFERLINQKWFDLAPKLVKGRGAIACQSDIVRYEVVAQYGGIYLDTDVECFKDPQFLLQNVSLFIADEWGPCNGNYMFGAIPNHPAMWTVVRELGPRLDKIKVPVNAVEVCGPPYLNQQLQKSQDLVIFPHMLFNPLSPYDDPDQVQVWPSCSYGNHRFSGKWYDRTKNRPAPEFLHP